MSAATLAQTDIALSLEAEAPLAPTNGIFRTMLAQGLSLEAQYRTISVEAQGNPESVQSALARLPSFFKEVSAKLGDVFKSSIDAFWKPKDLNWAAATLQKHNYMDLRETLMPALPSLRTDYLTYITALDEDAKLASRVLHDYLEPLTKATAIYLGSHDDLGSHHPVETLMHFELKPFDLALKRTGRLLDPVRAEPTQLYGKLIKRQNDWPVILAHFSSLTKIFAQTDHAAFLYSVDRANDLLGKLLQRVSDDPSAYRISGPTLDGLTKAAYVTATAVEFYGLTYKRAMALEEAMERLVETVKNAA